MINHASIWGTGESNSSLSTIKTEKTDVCIIGAGITGLTTAYFLSKQGKQVTVVDRLPTLASGETSHTTAFLTSYFDTPSEQIKNTFDEQTACLIWEIGQQAIDQVEQIIKSEVIDCDWRRCTNYVIAAQPDHAQILQTELAYARKAGISTQYHHPPSPLEFIHYDVLELHHQAKLHPINYLKGIIDILHQRGVKFIHSHAHSVEEKEGVQLITIDTDQTIASRDLVVTTHYPFTVDPLFSAKLEPYLSYVISAKIPKNTILEAIYQDTNDPYFYFRIDSTPDYDIITLGGADHYTGHAPETDPYLMLESYLNQLLLNTEYKITNKWSGQVLNAIDGIPYIGEYKPHHYLASGWAGNGMTFGTFSAQLISDLITHGDHPHRELFHPHRNQNKTGYAVHGAKTAAVEAAHLAQSMLSTDEDKIESDSGAVIAEKGKPVCVCKDQTGRIRRFSARCTHMGCIVRWNKHEKTFDCPCHGSRFNTKGEVITGPATKPLNPVVE